jgi:hypothetical protein
MLVDVRKLVDLDEESLTKVPFGRNRFLKGLGIALFSAAVNLALPKEAKATHNCNVTPCFGFCLCDCCNSLTAECCESGCCPVVTHSHCPGGGQCWTTCYGTQLWRCCDYHYGCMGSCDGCADGWPNHCLCRAWLGSC